MTSDTVEISLLRRRVESLEAMFLCDCSSADRCPLGKVGSANRCTIHERLAALEVLAHSPVAQVELMKLMDRMGALEKALAVRAGKQRPQEEGEVWEYMQQLGALAQEDALWFLDKMEASGWRNNGKPVASWQATVRVWKRGAIFPSQKHQNASNGQSSVPVATLQRALEQKQNALDAHKRYHRAEMGGGAIEWDHPDNLQIAKRMKEEIRQLQARLDCALGLNHPTR